MSMSSRPLPLQGIKVLEFAGLAPGPFCGMLLADAGASVLRIDRASPPSLRNSPLSTSSSPATQDLLTRHKSSIAVDIKSPQGLALVKNLAEHADVLIDPFRPGVMEKLGLGPDELCAANPRLVYARLTGFRRDGRYAAMAGHDINYLAVSGVLGLLGRTGEKPHAPWNIIADFAGGGAALFQGILLALLARQQSSSPSSPSSSMGKGQVVEANMVDGSAYLATFPRQALKTPLGSQERGSNLLDGGCPWYDTYETSDGEYMSVGALEPQFFTALIKGLGLSGQGWEENRWDISRWPELARVFTETFRSKTRAEWERQFDGTDACCVPVLHFGELEADRTSNREQRREGDQRPMVTLRDTPCLAVNRYEDGNIGSSGRDASRGQGPGVPGDGYEGHALPPGHGGEEMLCSWMKWKKGRDYIETESGLVLSPSPAGKPKI